MDPTAPFGFRDSCAAIVASTAKALSERPGETEGQQFARFQAAVHMIMGFLPRDTAETTLASHCVVLHDLMLESAHDSLRTEPDKTRRRRWNDIVALDRSFRSNLRQLEDYQSRPSEGRREHIPAGLATQEAGLADAPRPEPSPQSAPMPPRDAAATAAAGATEAAGLPLGHIMPGVETSAERLAACLDNQQAMAALHAGDAAGFARALGIAEPSAAFLAAAGAGSPFDPAASGPWPDAALLPNRTG